MAFTHISIEDVKQMMKQGDLALLDIRDQASFQAGHIDSAQHITGENIQSFIQTADFDKPVVVYCYHGNSSQGAADFLSEQGFTEVYSMTGGYTAWQQQQND